MTLLNVFCGSYDGTRYRIFACSSKRKAICSLQLPAIIFNKNLSVTDHPDNCKIGLTSPETFFAKQPFPLPVQITTGKRCDWKMVNPLDALNAFQDDIKKGSVPLEICQSDSKYHFVLDVVGGKNRFSCFEIRHGVIAAYVGLVNVGATMGVQRFQIGYAVIEQERSKGLGAAIVNASITELLRVVCSFGIYQVYIESVVELNNIHSINISKKCITSEYEEIIDSYSGEKALYFKTLRNSAN